MSIKNDDQNDKRLEEMRHKEEEDLIKILAEGRYGIPYIDLEPIPVENEALRFISEVDARKSGIAPFKVTGSNLHIAIRTPENGAVQEFKQQMEERGIICHFYMASSLSLEKAWSRYKELSFATTSRVGGLDIEGTVLLDIGKDIHTMNDAKKMVEEIIASPEQHKISHMLEIVLGAAIALGVSDVHIEPEEEGVRLRFRLDGALQDIIMFSYDINKLLNSRLKLISGLKLTNQAIAQDGRFSIFIREDEISIRVSVVPGAYGEGFVMRILNPKSIQVKLEEMGINDDVYQVMTNEIRKPNGLILITGPTGSGKTTTLYAFLQKIYTPEIKMITIEDPVEYHLEGITQTQVEPEKGYTFLEGLRAALRQDPDVIMVGEIRDAETAKIAVESALTGHLVFSTLHTNNAQGVIPRLIDLDVNPKILVSALTLSIAQRLVRVLCPVCKVVDIKRTPEEIALVENVITNAINEGKDMKKYNIEKGMEFKMYAPVGCESCNLTGYKGRIGIFESIKTDEAIEKIIPNNPSEREIKKVSQLQHLLDMKEDGIVKLLGGVTSFDEIKSVVDLSED